MISSGAVGNGTTGGGAGRAAVTPPIPAVVVEPGRGPSTPSLDEPMGP
ncbi:MAG: hypothetical protein M3N37_04015 [Actinomycetota bacterium]|nr:hypothetical protein [Actinomycetota bacterium]